LVGKPLQCVQCEETILSDADQTAQAMAYASEPDRSALIGHTILDFKMASPHTHTDAEAVDRKHAAFADG
jgi:hypothetical protein